MPTVSTPAGILEPPPIPAPPELAARAEVLVKKYNSQCFWFRHPDAAVETIQDIELVIQRLREYGNQAAWKDAQELHKCL
jgi:hypothetical protein